MWLVIKIMAFIFVLTSCEGSYTLTGTTYESSKSIKTPIDSVSIKVFVGKSWWFRGQTLSDSNGNFSYANRSTPSKATYYFIFEKHGFLRDTIIKEGSKGRSFFTIEHSMVKN